MYWNLYLPFQDFRPDRKRYTYTQPHTHKLRELRESNERIIHEDLLVTFLKDNKGGFPRLRLQFSRPHSPTTVQGMHRRQVTEEVRLD